MVWDNPAWCVGILEFPLSSADHKSPSRSSGLDRSESMLYAGSTSQLNGGGNAYLPDYSVRQLTPLQIIKVPSGCHFSHNSPALTPGSAYLSRHAVFQITRSHYQNAVTATRMDSSPQTPDADTRLTEGNSPDPPVTEHTATLMPPPHTTTTTTTLMPPPRELGRPSSARTRGQQSSVSHSTSLLNEKNRIVREYRTSRCLMSA